MVKPPSSSFSISHKQQLEDIHWLWISAEFYSSDRCRYVKNWRTSTDTDINATYRASLLKNKLCCISCSAVYLHYPKCLWLCIGRPEMLTDKSCVCLRMILWILNDGVGFSDVSGTSKQVETHGYLAVGWELIGGKKPWRSQEEWCFEVCVINKYILSWLVDRGQTLPNTRGEYLLLVWTQSEALYNKCKNYFVAPYERVPKHMHSATKSPWSLYDDEKKSIYIFVISSYVSQNDQIWSADFFFNIVQP